MKWKKKPRVAHGTTRVRKDFLLWPRCIDKEWRWLEFAKWEEEWVVGAETDFWLPQRWL